MIEMVAVVVEAVVVVVDQWVGGCEQGGEKDCDVDHGLPCGSVQQPLEAPAGLQLWLNLW